MRYRHHLLMGNFVVRPDTDSAMPVDHISRHGWLTGCRWPKVCENGFDEPEEAARRV